MSRGWMLPDWPAIAGVRAAITTRELSGHSLEPYASCNLGNRCGDDAEAVAANRASLIEALQLPDAPHWLRQVHGTQVINDLARASDGMEEPQADAAVSQQPNCVLAVLTADCLPVLFCARDGSAIGVAHAGWRGLAAGVLETTLAGMAIAASGVQAWIGPAIAAASYEVGEEVHAAFVDHDARANAAFAATRPGHWLCDLPALARLRLEQAGLSAIYGGDFDTFTDPRFYSYRRNAQTGRFASLIWRE